jgi:hypothetical protein
MAVERRKEQLTVAVDKKVGERKNPGGNRAENWKRRRPDRSYGNERIKIVLLLVLFTVQ